MHLMLFDMTSVLRPEVLPQVPVSSSFVFQGVFACRLVNGSPIEELIHTRLIVRLC